MTPRTGVRGSTEVILEVNSPLLLNYLERTCFTEVAIESVDTATQFLDHQNVSSGNQFRNTYFVGKTTSYCPIHDRLLQ